MTSTDQFQDRQAISDLLVRFGRWLDGDAGDPGDFYDEDIEVVSPRARLQGLDAVSDFIARTAGEQTQHVHSDVLVELDGDRAHVSANQLVHFYERGRPPYRSSGLRVSYALVRRSSGWRLSQMEIRLEWIVGDLPSVPASS